MVTTCYGLYHYEEKGILIIRNFKTSIDGTGVKYWNDHYFISNDRKLLRDKGKELKKKWLVDAELRVEFLKNVHVETKYK